MRRELLVFVDRLKFRAYRKQTGNFMFVVHASQIVIALLAIFGFFYSIVPESHLSTLQKLSEEKELQVTDLQNKIDADQQKLSELNSAIDERDQEIKLDAVSFETIVRDEFIFELAKEKDDYFDTQFENISKARNPALGDDAYADALNNVTLMSFYQDFLHKTQYAYDGLTEVRPIYIDMRQSFLKFMQNPPDAYSSDCLIQKDPGGKSYRLMDVHGKLLQTSYPPNPSVQPSDFVVAKRRCINEVFMNLRDAWLSERASQKGPEGYWTKNGLVLGPLPEKH